MAVLREAIKKVTGSEKDKARKQEQLRMLQSMAETNLQLMTSQIKDRLTGQGDLGKLYIVPEGVVLEAQKYHVTYEEGFAEGIQSAVDFFFTKSEDAVKKGFVQVAHAALSSILATGKIGESKELYYFVMIENNAFVRVDIGIWKYELSQPGIVGDIQQAICYSIFKSVIDHNTVSDDLMIYLVSQYVGDDIPEVKAFIEKLKSLYAGLKDTDSKELLESLKSQKAFG